MVVVAEGRLLSRGRARPGRQPVRVPCGHPALVQRPAGQPPGRGQHGGKDGHGEHLGEINEGRDLGGLQRGSVSWPVRSTQISTALPLASPSGRPQGQYARAHLAPATGPRFPAHLSRRSRPVPLQQGGRDLVRGGSLRMLLPYRDAVGQVPGGERCERGPGGECRDQQAEQDGLGPVRPAPGSGPAGASGTPRPARCILACAVFPSVSPHPVSTVPYSRSAPSSVRPCRSRGQGLISSPGRDLGPVIPGTRAGGPAGQSPSAPALYVPAHAGLAALGRIAAEAGNVLAEKMRA